jgi:hypothetical protein
VTQCVTVLSSHSSQNIEFHKLTTWLLYPCASPLQVGLLPGCAVFYFVVVNTKARYNWQPAVVSLSDKCRIYTEMMLSVIFLGLSEENVANVSVI